MHIVLVFNPYPIHHCGLHIVVQMYMDVEPDDEWIKVEGNPLIYIMRWNLEKRTRRIYMAYTVKGVIIEKLVKLNNVCYLLYLF